MSISALHLLGIHVFDLVDCSVLSKISLLKRMYNTRPHGYQATRWQLSRHGGILSQIFPTVFTGELVFLPPPHLSLFVGHSLPPTFYIFLPSLSVYPQVIKDFMAVRNPRATPTITVKTVLKFQMGTGDCVLKQSPTETEGHA